MRTSRSGPRRAIVLAAVQLLMIAHVVQWLLTGRTVTPVEPSETIESINTGAINAGAIFFCAALLSTLILGRWFCGWGCHLVMLQDLCGWIMKKLGVRPRPFRSRLLVYGPTVLALYLFVWPLVRRTIATWLGAADPAWSGLSLHLTTDDFWRTFPGVTLAIPFLLICGFAAVYFLGAKGFCTYGCPYGGFFAPLDRYAPARIRVTDACQQCGHCTAVCTSNVRVHEEVHAYGMVVDPGCMKCLDCVSVCPNDALYYGFGRPAALKGPPRHVPPRRIYDLTRGEDALLAVLIVVSYVALVGVYDLIPGLMAAGSAGIVAFLVWKLWRLSKDANVGLQNLRLKVGGKLTRGGMVFAGLACVPILLTAHSGLINGLVFAGGSFERRVGATREQVFASPPALDPPPAPDVRAARRAAELLCLSFYAGDGGLGLRRNPAVVARVAWLECVAGDFDLAERLLRELLARYRPRAEWVTDYARLLRSRGRPAEALNVASRTLRRYPELDAVRRLLIEWFIADGRVDEAAALCREGLARAPGQPYLLTRLGGVLCLSGQTEAGIGYLRAGVAAAPRSAEARNALGAALGLSGRFDEAQAELARALELDPDNPAIIENLARVREAARRPDAVPPPPGAAPPSP